MHYEQSIVDETFIELAAADRLDKFDVDGNITLAGKLHDSLLGGYVPMPSTNFQILDRSGTRNNTFDDIVLDPLPMGLRWDTS